MNEQLYRLWAAWRLQGGRRRDRPGGLPVRIPVSWWRRFKAEHPPPVVPVTHPAEPWLRVLVLAGPIPDALVSRPWYRLAVTADPGYDVYARADHAAQAKAQGRDVYVWYVPTQVSKQRADEVAARLGASRIIGQAETSEEFAVSVEHGRVCVVGNVHALSDSQRGMVADGRMAFIQEDYWNAQPWTQRDYRNLPVASGCIAVYDAHSEHPDTVPAGWHPDVQAYLNAHRLFPGDGMYGPGASAADFRALP